MGLQYCPIQYAGADADQAQIANLAAVQDHLMANGDTVVLGGIFQDETASQEEKVPWLGDIPAVGALFRRRANEVKKRELLIFVTPTIVEDRPVL